MLTKNQFIKEYSKSLQEGKASLFIGSGISRKSGYARWKDILKECAEEIELNVEKESQDLITLAQFYVNDKNRTKINQTISDYFKDSNGDITEVHKKLCSFPVKSIWTTNYDTLIERSLASLDINYSVLTDDKSYTSILRNAKILVHKIHGDVKIPSECIITRSDYESYEKKHDIVLSELKGEMCANSFLFLGYSFSDTDIQHILSKIRLIYQENNPQRHYCIMEKVKQCDCDDQDDYKYKKKRETHYVKDMNSYGIEVVLIDSYDEIDEILAKIAFRVNIKNVFISGAYEDKSNNVKNRISPVAKLLAENLIRKGYKIYTGYGKNLGADIVAGAFTGCASAGKKVKNFNENVFLFPFPYILPNDVNRATLYTNLRKNVISRASISIFICGEKDSNGNIVKSPGCIEEYEISKEQGNLLIPLSTTGGASLAIWDKEEKRGFIDDELKKLKTEVNPERIVEIVINIIEKYIKSIE